MKHGQRKLYFGLWAHKLSQDCNVTVKSKYFELQMMYYLMFKDLLIVVAVCCCCCFFVVVDPCGSVKAFLFDAHV